MQEPYEIIDRITADAAERIGVKVTQEEWNVLKGMSRQWLWYACGFCNRTDCPPAMTVAVCDTVVAAYYRRGEEGAVSSSVGGQNMTYEDLYATLRERLIAAGLRRLRL